jgi:cysteine desulfurase
MMPFLQGKFGNPHSAHHRFGLDAADAVAAARVQIAAAVGGLPEDVVFTSGATEANNLALAGLTRAPWPVQPRLIAPQTEHKSVLEPLTVFAKQGFELDLLRVGSDGLLDLDELERALRRGRAIVSVMAANSEIGVLQPMAEIGAACRRHGAVLHTDASQALGKMPVDMEAWQADLLTFSGHKAYGPMGIGALIADPTLRRRMVPLTIGGGQQDGLRAGTLPTFLCVGLGEAARLSTEALIDEPPRLAALRDRLLGALARGAGAELNGSLTRRLPGNLNLRFPNVEALALITRAQGVAISTGSACASSGGSVVPSHVLRAIGLDDEAVRSSVRISIGRYTTEAEVDQAAEILMQAANEARTAY